MNLTFMDAGQLTARLELQTPTEISDGQGGVTASWSSTSMFWGRIEPVSAASDELGHVERDIVTHRIWVRQSGAVKAGLRFRKSARIFEIRTVHDPDETGRYLVCHVTEM